MQTSWELFQLTLARPVPHADHWILALASLRVNQYGRGSCPVLFRFAPEADNLPTGVAWFDLPLFDYEAGNPAKRIGTEVWHATIRGAGAS
jgi:hypothetical protein